MEQVKTFLSCVLLAVLTVLAFYCIQIVHDADVAVSSVPRQIEGARSDIVSQLRSTGQSVVAEEAATRRVISEQLTGARVDLNTQITAARADLNKNFAQFLVEIKSLKIRIVPW